MEPAVVMQPVWVTATPAWEPWCDPPIQRAMHTVCVCVHVCVRVCVFIAHERSPPLVDELDEGQPGVLLDRVLPFLRGRRERSQVVNKTW